MTKFINLMVESNQAEIIKKAQNKIDALSNELKEVSKSLNNLVGTEEINLAQSKKGSLVYTILNSDFWGGDVSHENFYGSKEEAIEKIKEWIDYNPLKVGTLVDKKGYWEIWYKNLRLTAPSRNTHYHDICWTVLVSESLDD